ncbi:hypothetical protein PMAYCL1PPCAC_21528 [Pristionchus mayeri]|uniref:CRAL-TRIO domain-containing protein n=1 Tax=Pristionchus mayeri TaxID=1317129 RepID=A0AAN5CUW6_9BILA|nr:hypothetical protein PMAYCL1PPCAC_21528 [Pristionchus mayeri]
MEGGAVPAKLSDSDRQKVEQLRAEVKEYLTPYYDTDFNLLRWLVGHDYNMELLKPKLINHLILRKVEDWNLDGLMATPRNHAVHAYWKSGLTGEAVKTPNAIVNIEQSGTNDYWGLLQTYPTNVILRARVYDLESMLAAVMKMEARTGERASMLFIMDLTGLKFDRNLTTLITGGLASLAAFMSDHYVELIHTFVLVNVPSFIHAIWTLARPLLPERTRSKVNILGSNWRQEILELADASALPSFWNVYGSSVFTAQIERAVPVAQELYYKGSMPPEPQSLSCKAGKSTTIDMDLMEVSLTHIPSLSFYFFLKLFISVAHLTHFQGQSIHYLLHADGQFAIAIYYSDDVNRDGENIERWKRVYPLFQKIPGPTIVPMKDSLKCPYTGTYKMWLSNEHAWFHTLKITYHLTIE